MEKEPQPEQPTAKPEFSKKLALVRVVYSVLMVPATILIFLVIKFIPLKDDVPGKRELSQLCIFCGSLCAVFSIAFALSITSLFETLRSRPVKWRSKKFIALLVATILSFLSSVYLLAMTIFFLLSS